MQTNPVQKINREVVPSYGTTSKIVLLGSILGLGCNIFSANPAQAVTFTYSGDTTGKPTFDRPNSGTPPTATAGSNAYRYDVFQFTVDTAGSYIFNSTSPYDNYGFLYQNAFNAATPLANIIVGDDDSSTSGSFDYRFTTNLNVGTNYFLVSTGFNTTSDFGAFTTTIDGLGTVSAASATSVPEPFTVIGTLIGGTAAVRLRKKLARQKQD
jgi:hypothetical protein